MRRFLCYLSGFLLVWICCSEVACACLWIDGATVDGWSKTYSPGRARQVVLAMGSTPADKLSTLDRTSRDGGADRRESEAVRKILSGDPAAAIPLLQESERETPGKYSIAANLGTAYELAGDNHNALKWIEEGIRRNAASHGGTEWLHVLILQTKLRMERDPGYLKSHRIITLPEKFDAKTKVNIEGTERTVGEILGALYYQLQERVVFVKPPDPIVADLLYTYGLCEAHTFVLEEGLEILKKAKEYGFQDPALLQKTEARYESIIETAHARGAVIGWALKASAVLGLFALIAFLAYCYRRRWFTITLLPQPKKAAERRDPF